MPWCGPDGGHRRQSIGEDDGRRRAFGTRCRQEDRGAKAVHHGGFGGQPDRGSGSPGRRAGPGRCAGSDGGPPGQGSGGSRRRLPTAGTGATGLRDRPKELQLPDILEIVGKSKETEGFEVIPRRRVVGADADGSPGTSSGAWSSPWPRTRSSLPPALPHPQDRARDKGLVHNNMMMAMTHNSGPENPNWV